MEDLATAAVRRENRESWVGIVTGIGCCGLLAIATALALAGGLGEHYAAAEKLAVAWTFVSLGMLGLIVALLPYAMYEWTHMLRAEYSDE